MSNIDAAHVLIRACLLSLGTTILDILVIFGQKLDCECQRSILVRVVVAKKRTNLAEAMGFDPATSRRYFRLSIPHPTDGCLGHAIFFAFTCGHGHMGVNDERQGAELEVIRCLFFVA
jgi:hypothetical protein